MHYYKFGCYDEEDSDYIELTSEKYYTEEEFAGLVYQVAPAIIASHHEERVKRIGEQHDSIKRQPTVNFFAVVTEVADALCEQFGFKRLEYTCQFSTFGRLDLTGADDRYLPYHDKPHVRRLHDTTKALIESQSQIISSEKAAQLSDEGRRLRDEVAKQFNPCARITGEDLARRVQ